MIVGLLVGIGILNIQSQCVFNGNLSNEKPITISLSYANNEGSAIKPDNVSIVTNQDKTKFKIVGPTPIIVGGTIQNLSELTNSSGSEFYYFATNSDVSKTTKCAEPGKTYYLSPYSIEETSSSMYTCGEGLQNMTASKASNPSQYTAKEVWYDMPEKPTTIYSAFITPSNAISEVVGGTEENIVFSHSVTTLPDSVFKDSSTVYNCVIPNSITTLPTSTFNGCTNLTNVEIPNTVNLIDTYAFENCTSLTSVTISDGLTSVGNYAFYGCTSLTSVTIPESVTSIGIYTFAGCTNLSSISIPNSVTSIGASAFYNCKALKNITIGSGVASIGDDAFRECSSLESIKVTSGNSVYHSTANCLIETSSKTLLLGCKNSSIPTDGSVTVIGSPAFYGCDNLTSVIIPSSVTSIGGGAFYHCYKLVEVYNLSNLTITAGSNDDGSVGKYIKVQHKSLSEASIVKEVDNYIYYGTSGGEYGLLGYKDTATDLTLPKKLDGHDYSIYQYAFTNSKELTNVTIPTGVTKIEKYAFAGCSNLVNIGLPITVTNINNYAFYECGSLKVVSYDGSEEQWEAVTIGSNNTDLTSARVVYLDGWRFVMIKTEPTCTADGIYIYEKDGVQKEVIIPKVGHTVGSNGRCTVCGQELLTVARTTNATYEFVRQGTSSKYISNNQNKNSTDAKSTLTAKTSITIKISWEVDSERNYDKLTIVANGITKVNAVSGQKQSGNFTVSLSAGDTINFIYHKDGSVHSNSDTATFTISYIS